LQHTKKVLGVTFISNDQTPEVLQPGALWLNRILECRSSEFARKR
jgi:hypothetical protein